MECNCNIRQKLVGDGCSVCNPALALELANETLAALEAHRNMVYEALIRLRDALEPTYSLSPEGRSELAWIDKALNYDL